MTDSEHFTGELTRSYAEANRELVNSFIRYMESRGLSARTIESYRDSCQRYVESLGSVSALDVERSAVRTFLMGLLDKGLTENSARLHTAALRVFYRFLTLSGLTRHNPMLLIAQRKVPRRLPRVLSVEEIEALITAARNPFERAVPEVLYATGVRISELLALRLENIDFAEHVILVKDGKGGKDRYVLFGQYAARAMQEYLAWRPSKVFLFERPAWKGCVNLNARRKCWYGRLYTEGIQRQFYVGNLRNLPTKEDARKEFDRIAANIPGFHPHPATPYRKNAIRVLLNKLARRAGIGKVHPHALRRAMACQMLQGGADLPAIQKLLGHERLGTTQLYTHLTAQELKAIHQKCHPHEQGGTDEEE